MSEKRETVMEQLIAACTTAHFARVPLIMVDTEELELMDRLARESELVDFFRRSTRTVNNRHIPYYHYIDESPLPLSAYDNFTYSTRELAELINRNALGEFEGATLTPDSDAPGKGPLSVMAVFHITHESWKQGTAANASGVANDSLIHFLREYVNAYQRCMDPQSILRNCRVLLYGDPTLLPRDLTPYTEILTVPYPQIWELEQVVRRIAEKNHAPVTSGDAPMQLAEQMSGFTLIQAERFVQKLFWTDRQAGTSVLDIKKYYPLLMEEKARAVRSAGGLLELHVEKDPPNMQEKQDKKGSSDDEMLGGMDAYKKWVTDRTEQMHNFSDYASQRGVPALKGVLLCGVPGCGKSLAAKTLQQEWGISMLRMDIDRLMGGLVGDSERNMRQALALAETMSPVILWIDEIEKGFAAASSSSNDGGTFKRMFGRLLTWMQENTKPCFIFATANDISMLPPEFFRSGRFDALFSVYMPSHKECKRIFKVQMKDADKLRRKQYKAKGGDPRQLPPLFDDSANGCYSEDCLEAIMRLVMGGKKQSDAVTEEYAKTIRYLSGADIYKIVTTALAKISASDMEKGPITRGVWLEALETVLTDPTLTTQGSSSSNLDEIAACYVRLMRKNFAPVSEESALIFQRKYYTCTANGAEVKAEYTGKPDPKWPAYDRALYLVLKPRIQNIASQMETNALGRISY